MRDSRAILTWPGKYAHAPSASQSLIEVPEFSCQPYSPEAPHHQDNLLISGDNRHVISYLEKKLHQKIKLIYIDPPYNSGQNFTYYSDKLSQSDWLSNMYTHLKNLKPLLREDGFICCQIDDSSGPYLKVLLDEIYHPKNYLATLSIRVRFPHKTLRQDLNFHREIEYIHVYQHSSSSKVNRPTQDPLLDKFCHYIDITASPKATISLGGKKVEIYYPDTYKIRKDKPSAQGLKEIWASGTVLDVNSSGRFYRDYISHRTKEDGLGVLYRVFDLGADNLGYRSFLGPRRAGATKGKYYQGVPASGLRQKNISPVPGFFDLAGAFGNCRNEGGVDFRGGKKPEILLELLLDYFSEPDDWVLDSFAGSGTTGAVAHKMSRQWVMIERGHHCTSHIFPRLRSVVHGDDQTGVTRSQKWTGGGGFKFLRTAN